MENFGNLIKSLDFFSLKTHLTINDKGETRYKNLLGGFLSFIYIIISVSVITFCIYRLLNKDDLHVIYSIERDEFINFTYSNKLPIMVRLSDYYRRALKTEKLYNISLKIWYNFYNNTLNDYTINVYDDIILEQCDINKHFGDYKKYFEKIKNINTYYCPLERLPNQTIFGIYGDNSNFSFYYYYFSKCSNNNCYTEEEINKTLSNAYLDLIFVDYSINNLNKKQPNQLLIKSERIMTSSMVYKRINLYFRQIKYITDNGIFINKKKKDYFHQLDSIRFDTDIRDIYHSEEPKTFLTLSISNASEISVYNRYYLKFQDYLANICGIIKALNLFFHFINYNFAKNSYYIRIIKDFLIENSQLEKNCPKKSINFDFSSLNNSGTNFGKKSVLSSSSLQLKLKEKEIIETKFKFRCLPIGFNFRRQKDYSVIEKSIKIINNRLSVIRILNKLEIIENLKKETQNLNSFFLNNSNIFHNIDWKDKESNNKYLNSSMSSKKINNFFGEERKINSLNSPYRNAKKRITSKFFPK